MKSRHISHKLRIFLVCLFAIALTPWAASAGYLGSEQWDDRPYNVSWKVKRMVALSTGTEGWEQQLTGFVIVQEGVASSRSEAGSFDPYVGQILLVRSLYDRGDVKETYQAMNRFMDMLEVREGGIPSRAAEATWDFCYEVTPPALHDVKRHQQWWDKTVDWEKFFWEE